MAKKPARPKTEKRDGIKERVTELMTPRAIEKICEAVIDARYSKKVNSLSPLAHWVAIAQGEFVTAGRIIRRFLDYQRSCLVGEVIKRPPEEIEKIARDRTAELINKLRYAASQRHQMFLRGSSIIEEASYGLRYMNLVILQPQHFFLWLSNESAINPAWISSVAGDFMGSGDDRDAVPNDKTADSAPDPILRTSQSRKRGRIPRTPQRKSEERALYNRWRESNIPLEQFAKDNGKTPIEMRKLIDRCRPRGQR